MVVWICIALWCLISSVLISYAPESDIQVKSYDNMSLSRASVVQFRASRYIIGLNPTSESKVVAVWVCLVLPCLISSITIYYVRESGIRVGSYDHLNFSRAFVLQFQAFRYINGLNRTSESKVMAIGIFLPLWFSKLSISIYYGIESDIWVQEYGRLNLPCALTFNFEHLDILCAWISIRVKFYDHLDFSTASIVQFQASWYITGLNWTSKPKFVTVLIFLVLPCLILSITIYHAPESSSEWKVMTIWISRELPLFNFECLDILLVFIAHPSQKWWPFEFALRFDV